jgi:hypothetical protein
MSKKSKSLYPSQHLYDKSEVSGSGSISLTNAQKHGDPDPAPDPQHWFLSHRKYPDIYKYPEVPWHTCKH